MDNEGDIKSLRGANYVIHYMIKIDADLIKCVRDTTGNSSFVVVKPSIRRGKLSLNPSRSIVMSSLLSQDLQLKNNGRMQCANKGMRVMRIMRQRYARGGGKTMLS